MGPADSAARRLSACRKARPARGRMRITRVASIHPHPLPRIAVVGRRWRLNFVSRVARRVSAMLTPTELRDWFAEIRTRTPAPFNANFFYRGSQDRRLGVASRDGRPCLGIGVMKMTGISGAPPAEPQEGRLSAALGLERLALIPFKAPIATVLVALAIAALAVVGI